MDANKDVISEIEDLVERYPDIPIEAIVKEDLLRRGMAWSPAALETAAHFKRKAYFIFSFDMVPMKEMAQKEFAKAPEEIRLADGPHNFRPTIVSVRLNPASPYCVDFQEESLVLKLDGRKKDPVAAWMKRREETLMPIIHMLKDMKNNYEMDYPTVSVAISAFEKLTEDSGK